MEFDPSYLEFIRPLLERRQDGTFSLEGIPYNILPLFYKKRFINKKGKVTPLGKKAYEKYLHEKNRKSNTEKSQIIHSIKKTA